MKINDLYSRVETEKQSRRLLALSIIAPTILLLLVVLMAIFSSRGTILAKQTKQLDVISDAVSNFKFWDEKTGVAEAISGCKAVYYDKEGHAVNAEAGFPEQYDATLDNVELKIKGSSYRCKSGKMIDNSYGLATYTVYLDTTSDNKTIVTFTWTAVAAFLIAFVLLFAATYALVMTQMRFYERAINRNNRLVSDISHEFNTPLAIIKSSMSQILSEPDSKVEDISESLVTVTHEAGRLSRMVKDMLVLSRSDNERLIIEKKNCDITAIVKEVVEPFQMMCDLSNKEMVLDIEEDVKSRVDEDKLRQSLIILLDNATKYTKEGESITVTLYSTFSKYVIEVADTGDGVSDSELQNIFERFYRTDTSRTAETGGSGLGLSIVKAIMTALKGKVYASHNDPKGLRIDLEFPKEKFTQILQNEK